MVINRCFKITVEETAGILLSWLRLLTYGLLYARVYSKWRVVLPVVLCCVSFILLYLLLSDVQQDATVLSRVRVYAWRIIMGSWSDDWNYWRLRVQLLLITTAHSQWLPKTRAIPYWTTSVLLWLTRLWFTSRSLLRIAKDEEWHMT
jgi:hypothetical protein